MVGFPRNTFLRICAHKPTIQSLLEFKCNLMFSKSLKDEENLAYWGHLYQTRANGGIFNLSNFNPPNSDPFSLVLLAQICIFFNKKHSFNCTLNLCLTISPKKLCIFYYYRGVKLEGVENTTIFS